MLPCGMRWWHWAMFVAWPSRLHRTPSLLTEETLQLALASIDTAACLTRIKVTDELLSMCGAGGNLNCSAPL